MSKAKGLSVSKGGLSELKKRLLVVFFTLLVYRIGAYIPVPGLDAHRLASLFHHHQNGILGLFNMFSGGALSRFTIFALGIMPYISASIILQLFTSVSPKLEQLKKEGDSGRRKISQYTRYATLGLAAFQGIGISRWLVSQGIAVDPTFHFYFIAVITLMTGTMFLMWLGEQATERGIGNGISLIIFASIVSRLPSAAATLLEQMREGQIQGFAVLIIAILICMVIGFVVYVEMGQRQIQIKYAQRQQGRRMYGGQSSHLPLKVNMSGVIPPIFASSIILLPGTIAQWFSSTPGMRWLSDVSLALQPGQPLYLVVFSMAIIFFSFFYAALTYNPRETADNLKQSGAFIPGIRPGDQTVRYIDKVMTKLTLVGALYLVLVCLVPTFFVMTWHVPFYFGGTSLLIVVVVVMDFMAQVQSHLMSHQYESLLRKSKLKGGLKS